jgi:carbon-monoxide dehydrogenase medium subunit
MGVGEAPILSQKALEILVGQKPTEEALKAVAETCATSEIDPATDLHATADYRRNLIRALVVRSLNQSIARAKKGG